MTCQTQVSHFTQGGTTTRQVVTSEVIAKRGECIVEAMNN